MKIKDPTVSVRDLCFSDINNSLNSWNHRDVELMLNVCIVVDALSYTWLREYCFLYSELSLPPQNYISCAEAWIEYVCKHFTVNAAQSLISLYLFIKKFNF